MTSLILSIGLAPECMQALHRHFKPPQYGMAVVDRPDHALEWLRQHAPRIAVIGPGEQSSEDQLDLARRIKAQDRRMPVILVNRESSEARAVAALKAGINDYFTMPLSFPAFSQALEAWLAPIADGLDSPAGAVVDTDAAIVGHGSTMHQIKRYLQRVAAADSTVLITGESGTGKELIAQTIHRRSARADHPMVCVNCAAIPENLIESELFGYHKGAFTGAIACQKGKFVLANHGTLFLDEIGEMSLLAQAKILRCIETDEIFPLGAPRSTPLDVRIIAATNRAPEALVAAGRFREDLYYRLNVAHVHLPPLRERKEDIPDLVAMGIDHLNSGMGRNIRKISDTALAALIQHSWPGNVRELNNVLESAFIQCETKCIEFNDFPRSFIKKLDFTASRITSDKDRLMLALADADWNKSKAAKTLHWSRMRVYRAIKRYNIVTPATSTK